MYRLCLGCTNYYLETVNRKEFSKGITLDNDDLVFEQMRNCKMWGKMIEAETSFCSFSFFLSSAINETNESVRSSNTILKKIV